MTQAIFYVTSLVGLIIAGLLGYFVEGISLHIVVFSSTIAATFMLLLGRWRNKRILLGRPDNAKQTGVRGARPSGESS
jgi:hypothetical protein